VEIERPESVEERESAFEFLDMMGESSLLRVDGIDGNDLAHEFATGGEES